MKTNYDYEEAMYNDIEQWLTDNEYQIDFSDFSDVEDFEQYLDETLWVEDSVTGNASGSYTFNRNEARDYVLANMGLLKEAYTEFCQMDSLGEQFINEDWESMDVTIRCYLLSSVIASYILDNEGSIKEAIAEANED